MSHRSQPRNLPRCLLRLNHHPRHQLRMFLLRQQMVLMHRRQWRMMMLRRR
jgi:hypothetical protein